MEHNSKKELDQQSHSSKLIDKENFSNSKGKVASLSNTNDVNDNSINNKQHTFKYPEINPYVISNIFKSLYAVPSFYHSVLDLMHSMNIPFESNLLVNTTSTISNQNQNNKRAAISEDEQDESEDEIDIQMENKVTTKRIKFETKHVNVDKLHKDIKTPNSINNLIQIKIGSNSQSVQSQENGKYRYRDGVIKLIEINNSKASTEELELINKKKLDVGVKSRKLYLKNLAKSVDNNDFYFLFGRYFESDETMKDQLNIVHYKEGRLKNQAFITFPNDQLAEDAIQELQGFKLKNKPIIILYGKQIN